MRTWICYSDCFVCLVSFLLWLLLERDHWTFHTPLNITIKLGKVCNIMMCNDSIQRLRLLFKITHTYKLVSCCTIVPQPAQWPPWRCQSVVMYRAVVVPALVLQWHQPSAVLQTSASIGVRIWWSPVVEQQDQKGWVHLREMISVILMTSELHIILPVPCRGHTLATFTTPETPVLPQTVMNAVSMLPVSPPILMLCKVVDFYCMCPTAINVVGLCFIRKLCVGYRQFWIHVH